MWGPQELGLDTTHKYRRKYSPDIDEGTSVLTKETHVHIDADRIVSLLETRIRLYFTRYLFSFWNGELDHQLRIKKIVKEKKKQGQKIKYLL